MSIESDQEGTLYKWTNYWGGWQPRWVVLHKGILSYYNSSDEVGKGCRASIKISASDILAYPNDNTRLDIVVPHEQRWYLKASNAAERQAWLISLGTSKANTGEKESVKLSAVSQEHSSEIKKNMNEVRLFCDLLVQQACQVKEQSLKDKPDAAVLSDSCVVLSTACDTFLAALSRCIEVSENNFNPPTKQKPLRSLSYDGQPALPQLNSSKSKTKKRHTKSIGQSPPTTPIRSLIDPKWNSNSPPQPALHEVPLSRKNKSETSSLSSSSSSNVEIALTDNSKSNAVKSEASVRSEPAQDKFVSVNAAIGEDSLLTFFSAMLHSFSDIVLQEDGGIPTVSFLSACEGILPFLNTIGSTAFAPVRIDFMGNVTCRVEAEPTCLVDHLQCCDELLLDANMQIWQPLCSMQKLKTKHSSDPTKYKTLQKILDQEINSCTTRVRNSATDALMWLKRGLRFMQKFLIFFKDGERDLTVALNQAYSVTLKPYHGWVVKGIFALAVKSAPYSNDFIRALATNPDHADDKRFVGVLMKDIEQYTIAMDVVLNLIDNYYQSFHLESTDVV